MFYNSRQDDQRSRQHKPKSQPSKLKFLLGRHLANNSFALGRLFYKSSSKILGAIATKMVATWRVVFVRFLFIISNVTTVSVE